MARASQRLATSARLLVTGATVLLALSCVNFHTVEKGRVYRSGQPTGEQLQHWIWRYQLQTVLDLRPGEVGEPDFDASRLPSVAAGIDFVHLPMSPTQWPTTETLDRLCSVFENARYPMLIHCRAGADRTGLASAIYMLHRYGDLARARGELSLAYGHVSWAGTGRLDQVLEMYGEAPGGMTFCEWARRSYRVPAQ